MQAVACFTIPAGHPSLPGHFPGHPVVPGVVLLAEVLAAIEDAAGGRRVAALPMAKFIRPVLPDQAVAVEMAVQCDPASGDKVPFTCTVAGQAVLRGTARLAPSPGPAP